MAPRRPNVLFLVTDDQRHDALGAAGNPHIRTPVQDALAGLGVLFTHACIPGGTCQAVCMPSRAMIHSGRTLFRLQGEGGEIPADHVTLAETFRQAGYRTFGTGKWHSGRAAFHRGFGEGGEIFFGGMADHWNVPVYNFDPTGRYDQRCLYVENIWTSNATKARECDHIHAGRHSTDVIADAALRFIARASEDEPFFMYVAFLAPHDPRTMPRRFLDLYDPAALPLPPNFAERHPFDNGELQVRDEQLAGFPRQPDEIRRHLADYYAMISHLDARIGDLLKALEDRGLRDDTIIVLAGDNGLALGQHGLMGKQSLYDHSVRVPLVIAGPGVPRGVRTDGLAYLLDVYPTLCELTGLPVPASVEGRSLAPMLRDPAAAVREAVYLAYRDRHRGVRTDRWKLIEYVVDGRHAMTQLFDLVADPWELRNLAGEPGLAPTLSELRRTLLRLRDEWSDANSAWGKAFWEKVGLAGDQGA